MKFAKYVILASALLVSHSSFAGECQEYVMKRFGEIRANAVEAYPQHAKTLASLSSKFIGKRDFYGKADVLSFHIEFSVDICELPQVNQDRVVAHEIGHVISWLVHPSMRKEATSKIYFLTEHQHEIIADGFGARILENSLNHEIVNMSEKKCIETQEKYFCDVQVNWLYATTH